MEAMLLRFGAENSISYSVVPKVIELSKEHSQDPAALDNLSMIELQLPTNFYLG